MKVSLGVVWFVLLLWNVSNHVTGKPSGKLAYSSWINGKSNWVLLFLWLSQPRPAVLHQSCHQTQWVVCVCPAQLDLVCFVCSVRCLHVSLVFVLMFFVGNRAASRTSSQSDHQRERRSVAFSVSLCLLYLILTFRLIIMSGIFVSFVNKYSWFIWGKNCWLCWNWCHNWILKFILIC